MPIGKAYRGNVILVNTPTLNKAPKKKANLAFALKVYSVNAITLNLHVIQWIYLVGIINIYIQAQTKQNTFK